MKVSLTGLEDHFADHDPASCEIQLHLNETSETSVQVDGHVSGVLQHSVWHVRVDKRPSVVELSSHTKRDLRLSEHLSTHTHNTQCSFLVSLRNLSGVHTDG